MSPASPSTTSDDGVTTQAVTFPVTLPDSRTYDVNGVLYWRGQLEGKVLQIALHGATYDHRYWDVGDLDGHPYSYARYMASHGFAVLALDNLGAGTSGKPDGDFVRISIEALALHQIIQGLGSAPVRHTFRKIVLVGHSMGSVEAMYVQGTYHDADALVVTGWENTPHLPAGVGPEMIAMLLAEQYVVFPPFIRTMLFYAGNYHPAMPKWDNSNLAGVLPRGVMADVLSAMMGTGQTKSRDVTGPVLLVFAEEDALMPVALVPAEAATYSSASSVTTHIAAGVGHDLNLHLRNVDTWDRMKVWIRENVGDDAP